MNHVPLGEVCVSLGLMSGDQVERVLARLRDAPNDGPLRARFGEIAASMGFLDDTGLARALAQQFRLNMVPADRIERLNVAPEVLGLLPRRLVRERMLVPTFLDAEKRVLSLLTVDPTDLPSLRLAQTAAQASRLRLFVAPRDAMRQLVERLLPAEAGEDASDAASATHASAVTAARQDLCLIVEPDPDTAAAIRRLDALEEGASEVVSDPEQVAPFLDHRRVTRVFFRRAVARSIEPYLGAWRRACPQLLACPVEGFGPASRSAVGWEQARDFFLALTEFVLLAGETRQMDARARVRRTVRLARAVAEELDIVGEQRDAIAIAALFADLDQLTVVSGMLDEVDEGRRFATAMTVLRQFDPPWDFDGLYRSLERRVAGEEGPGRDLAADVLYTARAAVQASVVDGGDPVAALGADVARHDAATLKALASVLKRQGLRQQVAAGGGGSSTVLVAEREASLLTALEARLGQAGFDVVIAADGEQAAQMARNLQPAAILCNQRLPRKDGLTLLVELRREEATRHIPIILFTDAASASDVARGLELGAEDVLEKPVNLAVLLVKLRRALARRSHTAVGISGRLSELSLPDLLQTLSLGGKTALLQITGVPEPGGIQVRDGQIVAAQHGRRTGEEAFYSLMLLEDGRFDVRFEDTGANNLYGQSEFLLLEALRRRDEGRARTAG
jgi:DNA-binding response OmpR family regulator